MQDKPISVLLPFACPTQKSLRGAVAAMIRDIQRDRHETDQDTADRLGISVGTVRNARNEITDLGAVTIARIGHHYGAHYVDPYHRLYGACAQSLRCSKSDPLAPMAEAVATICKMRSLASEGGRSETPKEQLDALPALKEAARELTAYIASIESLRVAA
ncbi:MAG: hypothetical protein V4657_09345 [Pseudomonadota bacterium]